MSCWASLLRRLGLALVLILTASAALAQPSASVLRALGLPGGRSGDAAEIERVQTDLSWIGLHNGQINGQRDAETRASIRRFQLGMDARVTGTLTPDERRTLRRRARASAQAARFRTETFDWTGMELDLPSAVLETPELIGDDRLTVSIRGRDVANSAIYLRRILGRTTPSNWLSSGRSVAKKNDEQMLVSGTDGNWYYAVKLKDGRRTYQLDQIRSNEVRGIIITLSESSATHMRPSIARILSSFDPFHGSAVAPSDVTARLRSGDYPGSNSAVEWRRTMVGNGSGSIVSTQGHVLTNHHVVEGCARLTVNGTEAHLVGSDIRLDLGLVRAPEFAGRDPIRFAAERIDIGESVMVIGYPVFSISPSLNATLGVVSSTVGLFGDRTRIQITAPMQPGNSGGPVVSKNGAQVAVVASKPSEALREKNLIENVGWVIRGAVAVDFLERLGVRPLMANDAFDTPSGTIREVMPNWRRRAVRVECHKF